MEIDIKNVMKLRSEGQSLQKIAEQLGTHRKALSLILREHGIDTTSIRYKAHTVNWDKAIKDYQSGMSLTEVAKSQNVKYDVVRKYFIDNQVVIRTVREARQLKQVYTHRNVFEHLTVEGAYLLGWILSDGTMSDKVKGFSVAVSSKDKDHLMYLRNLVTDVPLYDGGHYHRFQVVNVDIYESLMKLGVKSRKSFTNYDINWKNIRKKHYPYLLLGLFEGDGSISKISSSVSMLLPKKLYHSIKRLILTPNGIEPTVCRVDNNNYELLNVSFSGESYYKFCAYIYSANKVFPLQRKRQRYIDNLERVANSQSQYRNLARRQREGIV